MLVYSPKAKTSSTPGPSGLSSRDDQDVSAFFPFSAVRAFVSDILTLYSSNG
jgi:hypothetical protein